MKPFNLAESRIVQRNYCQTHINKRIRVIGMFAALAIVVTLLSYGCNIVIAGKAEKAKAGLASVQKRCESIQQETDTAQAQLDQHQWQNQLSKTSAGWLNVLDAAIASMPEEVWVNRFETSPKESTLLIEGRAASYDALSAFIADLHRNSVFQDIRLGSTRITRIGSLTCIDFSLPIKLKAGASGQQPASTAEAGTDTARRPGA